MLEEPQFAANYHQGDLVDGKKPSPMLNPYNLYQMKRANIQILNLGGNPTHHGPNLPRSHGRPCHHSQKGWVYDDCTDIENDYFLIIIRKEFICGDKGDRWERSNHIGTNLVDFINLIST